MGKQIFELVGSIIVITGDPMIDGILVSIIGVISFSIAYNWVGRIFDAIGFYDSDIMSDVHWIIRIGILLGLSYIFIQIYKFVTWIFSFQWWTYIIVGIIIITMIILIYYARYKVQKRNNINKIIEISKEITKVETEVPLETVPVNFNKNYTRINCPRCNSVLVKRHGPYGDFYGCSSYGTTGCRYTRKYL